jgi:hypothetical protein
VAAGDPIDAVGAAGEEAAVASPPSATPLPAPSEAAEEGWAAEVARAAGPALVEAPTVVSGMSMEALGSLSPTLATEPEVALASSADSMPDKGVSLVGSEESEALVKLETFGA